MSAPGTRTSYDAVAADYAREIGDELKARPLERALLATLAELAGTGWVLDVGCGPGHVARYLSSVGTRVAATDLSPGMCAEGRRRGTTVPYVAADMTRLPIAARAVSALACFYAVIHLDETERRVAYGEFARVLAAGGHALISFHTSDPDHAVGEESRPTDWWGHHVELTFRFFDPVAETAALRAAGFELVARLDRSPQPGLEHPSERSYLLVRRT